MPSSKISEKERKEQLRALREELQTQIEADLAETLPELQAGRQAESVLGKSSGDDLSGKRILEALLFASAKPLTVGEIKKVTQGLGAKEIESLIQELTEEYRKEDRSFEIIEIAGGWQIVTKKAYAVWLARLELQKKIRQASQSALETLAILAYKQPVTRAEIEQIRGVDVSAVISTLLERGFIKIVGKKEVAGRPFLYGTTEKFLEHFGLKSIGDLPPIQEIKTLIDRAVRREELIGENEPQRTQAEN